MTAIPPDAMAIAAPFVERLHEQYDGRTPAVVYFLQRRSDGPLKIGHAARIAGRMEAFFTHSPDPVILHEVIPGGQPLEHWFHRRHKERWLFNEWYEPAGPIIEDARRFAKLHAAAFAESRDLKRAAAGALSQSDPFLADFDRLYRSGTTIVEIAKLAGVSLSQARHVAHKMRALGFDVPARRVWASRSPRFETTMSGSRARQIG